MKWMEKKTIFWKQQTNKTFVLHWFLRPKAEQSACCACSVCCEMFILDIVIVNDIMPRRIIVIWEEFRSAAIQCKAHSSCVIHELAMCVPSFKSLSHNNALRFFSVSQIKSMFIFSFQLNPPSPFILIQRTDAWNENYRRGVNSQVALLLIPHFFKQASTLSATLAGRLWRNASM